MPETAEEAQQREAELDRYIDQALARFSDPEMAANLFLRWSESNEEVRRLLPDLIAEYVRDRVLARQSQSNATHQMER